MVLLARLLLVAVCALTPTLSQAANFQSWRAVPEFFATVQAISPTGAAAGLFVDGGPPEFISDFYWSEATGTILIPE